MKCEVKYIQPGSIFFSAVPVLLFIIGLIGGLGTFVVIPNPMAPATMSMKLVAVGVFALVYMVAFLALIALCAMAYNLLTAGMGLRGIKVQLDELDEPGVDEDQGA